MNLTLTVQQLHDILDFANPSGRGADDEMETEVTIVKQEKPFVSSDGEKMPSGYYVFLTEYPEEGCYGPLGEINPTVEHEE